jgi:6-phospho-3-hexuloisomerase
MIETVVKEVMEVLATVKEDQAINFSKELKKAHRIFVLGEGRSGLMGKAFAMRLMHAGYNVYAVGETITPSIQEGDLLVAISGSGTTGSIVQTAKKAKEVNAVVLGVSTDASSPLAEVSDHLLEIPAATKYRRASEPDTIQPLGNQFDQSLHLLLDALIIYSVNQTSSHDEMKNRHANLE